VIKVQDLDVPLAAVDARVLEQVCGHVLAHPVENFALPFGQLWEGPPLLRRDGRDPRQARVPGV
jgi:hypothetical protein